MTTLMSEPETQETSKPQPADQTAAGSTEDKAVNDSETLIEVKDNFGFNYGLSLIHI